MRRTFLAFGLALCAVSGAAAATPAGLRTPLADPARAADRAKDATRKGGDILAFSQVKRGDKVLDLIPGGLYFTRLFSAVVGPAGHVYDVWPDAYAKEAVSDVEADKAVAGTRHYANVSVIVQPAATLTTPRPVDVVFTSQNYHDYPDKFMGSLAPKVLNDAVFAALKPGGRYIVIDHAAEAGSGLRDTDTLHRIDPAIVRKEVEAAGFVFDGESDVLRNQADDHKLIVFDKSIRGHTDQFAYRFKKPLG